MASAAFSSITYISIRHIAHKGYFFVKVIPEIFLYAFSFLSLKWDCANMHHVTSARNEGKTQEIQTF